MLTKNSDRKADHDRVLAPLVTPLQHASHLLEKLESSERLVQFYDDNPPSILPPAKVTGMAIEYLDALISHKVTKAQARQLVTIMYERVGIIPSPADIDGHLRALHVALADRANGVLISQQTLALAIHGIKPADTSPARLIAICRRHRSELVKLRDRIISARRRRLGLALGIVMEGERIGHVRA